MKFCPTCHAPLLNERDQTAGNCYICRERLQPDLRTKAKKKKKPTR